MDGHHRPALRRRPVQNSAYRPLSLTHPPIRVRAMSFRGRRRYGRPQPWRSSCVKARPAVIAEGGVAHSSAHGLRLRWPRPRYGTSRMAPRSSWGPRARGPAISTVGPDAPAPARSTPNRHRIRRARSRPCKAACASHAAILASAVSCVARSPMRRARVAARRATSMRSGVDRRDITRKSQVSRDA